MRPTTIYPQAHAVPPPPSSSHMDPPLCLGQSFETAPSSAPVPGLFGSSFSSVHRRRRTNHALQFRSPGRLLEVSLEMPVAGPDEVVVQVTHAGVCEIDLKILSGSILRKRAGKVASRESDRKRDVEVVPGMEVRGTVAAVGVAVSGICVGDEIVCCPYRPAGSEGFDKDEWDLLGVNLDGGWQQYCCVSQDMVWRLEPDWKHSGWANLIVELAKVTSAYSRWMSTASEKVLIVGGNIAAILWGLFLRDKDIDPVLCSDHPGRRGLAKRLGIEALSLSEVAALIREGEPLFDAVIDCTGRTEVIQDYVQWVDPFGTVLICGQLPSAVSVLVGPARDSSMLRIVDGSGCSAESFKEAINLAKNYSRQFTPDSLGVVNYSISEYNAAITAMRTEKVCKAILRLPDPRARNFLASPAAPLLSPSVSPCGIQIPQLFL